MFKTGDILVSKFKPSRHLEVVGVTDDSYNLKVLRHDKDKFPPGREVEHKKVIVEERARLYTKLDKVLT